MYYLFNKEDSLIFSVPKENVAYIDHRAEVLRLKVPIVETEGMTTYGLCYDSLTGPKEK